jgi:hydroxymethylpyrimidine/phosphomethylpyrimidine kinase
VEAAARAIAARGPRWVVVTGGHGGGDSASVIDVVYDAAADAFTALRHPRIAGGTERHGTGCSFSAALCAHLARDAPVGEAASLASAFVAALLSRGPSGVGGGHAPLVHIG